MSLPTAPETRPLALATGGMLAMAASIGVGRFIYTPILPAMVEDLGLSKGEAGLIASANFAGYLAGALLAAAIGRFGGRSWMLGALALSAATTAAMGLVSSLAPMLILRFGGGAASALVLILASALVLDRLARAQAGRFAALHFGGVGLGIAASAILVAVLLAAGGHWRGLWLWGGALSLLVLPLVLRLVPAGPAARTASVTAGGPAKPQTALLRLAVAYFLFGLGYVVTATFIVAIVRADPAMRPIEPIAWTLVGIAAIPSVWLWGLLARRIGLLAAYAAACIAEAGGVAASVLMPGISGAAVAALLLGGTFMALTALGLQAARAMAPAHPQRALGLLTAAFGLGQIIGPVAAGIAYDHLGSFTLPSLVVAAGLLLGAALTWRLDK